MAFMAIEQAIREMESRTASDLVRLGFDKSPFMISSANLAAAEELARFAEEKGLHEDYIIPSMEEWEVYPRVAAATAVAAIREGVARLKTTYEEEYEKAKAIIEATRSKMLKMIDLGFIKRLPEDVEEIIRRVRSERLHGKTD